MPGRLLIVEPETTRRIALRARLAGTFPDPVLAADADEARALTRADAPDLAVLGAGLAGAEIERLAATLRTLPGEAPAIVALRPAADGAGRRAALAAGLDDALPDLRDGALLLARLRSLLRDRGDGLAPEVRRSAEAAMGCAEAAAGFAPAPRIAHVAAEGVCARAQADALSAALGVPVPLTPAAALLTAQGPAPDAVLIGLPPHADAELELLPALRAQHVLRRAAIVVHGGDAGGRAVARALDLGAHDGMPGPFEVEELALRLRGRLAAKRRADQMRAALEAGLAAAVIDPLTGLHNRRYAVPQLARIAAAARREDRPFAVMIADLDHFKQVNDRHGHAAGDAVLTEVAQRLRAGLGPDALAARIGGEEFLLVVPDMQRHAAEAAARRLCAAVAERPFALPNGQGAVRVTISIGLAVGPDPMAAGHAEPEALLVQADRALYRAKARGRNCVRLGRPAA